MPVEAPQCTPLAGRATCAATLHYIRGMALRVRAVDCTHGRTSTLARVFAILSTLFCPLSAPFELLVHPHPRKATMPVCKVQVKWGKELLQDVELDTSESVEAFKAQLFDLTGRPECSRRAGT